MAIPQPGFRRRSVVAAPTTACLLFAHGAAAEKADACRFEALGTASVVAVLDGRTIRLADGRDLKLAAIDIPHDTGSIAAQASRRALENLLLGKDILLTGPSDAADRYGRTLAFAFVNGSETPVQYNLLSLGHARVSTQLQDKACLSALFREEQKF